ncbi:RQC domain-containing protein [Scopulibacillus darangshiensis]|uniref:RQC domain-containing protein n=1 Tax=Scopulibacillus darangshiensis TaxID=442528 RepID=A0A4R2P2I0_9BACL|nr:RQC-minor-1 family DNA-binding protein [Scopulibacillus darangshiensis]TCP28767.1 RQC domain-containing protein [Scopulibacillus darangshiensis]
MGKRVKRVQYQLDTKGIKQLPQNEIKAILRGADEMILTGGRRLLAKVLKGSKEKKVLELKLNQSPVYGYYKSLKLEDVMARIDWMIKSGYLTTDYDYRLPLLIYTDKGWEIERDTYSDELFKELKAAAEREEYDYVSQLKDRNRGMILLLIEKIRMSEDRSLIPILKYWQTLDYKKVRQAIQEVIDVWERNN